MTVLAVILTIWFGVALGLSLLVAASIGLAGTVVLPELDEPEPVVVPDHVPAEWWA